MKKKKDTYTFIDLFAGCGGLTEGFYRQGFKALTHVEYDHYACESLRTRMKYYGYPENKISVLEKDITNDDILECIEKEINNVARAFKILIIIPPHLKTLLLL